MSQPSLWQRVKTGSKSGFDKAYAALDKLGPPINKVSNKLGSEAFWPTTLDKESDKAARILKSFCKDGFYADEEVKQEDGPRQKQRVVQKIPEKVIRDCKGLAIFTTMRTGLWVSGAGGSGVLVARQADGSWSAPSGIMLHTAGLGFLVGVDIYDCVVVINTEKALEAFTKVRCTLGGEISAVAGPVGAGAVLETEVHKRQAPIYTYLKSRGFYAGVQIDGTIVIERSDENERFYGEKFPASDILAGKVRYPPQEIRRLIETIKAAQGDNDADESAIPTEAPPGDFEIDDGHVMSVPDKDDPDPYGVLALEKEGMSLKEAGSQKRASWEQFAFNPNPTSPIYNLYSRQSQDHSAKSASARSSWRSSAFGGVEPFKAPNSLRNSFDTRRSLAVMTDTSTQTDQDGPLSPGQRSFMSGHSNHSSKGSMSNIQPVMPEVPEEEALEPSHGLRISNSGHQNVSAANGYSTPPDTPPLKSASEDAKQVPERKSEDSDIDAGDNEYHEDDDFEDVQIVDQPVVHSVQAVQPAAQVISKARIVNVPKRLPPKLPPRNPGRNRPVVIVGPHETAAHLDPALKDIAQESLSSPETSPVAKPTLGLEQGDPETTAAPQVSSDTGSSQNGHIYEEQQLDRDYASRGSTEAEELCTRDASINEDRVKERVPGGFE